MAPVQWCNLSGDILYVIVKHLGLNSDFDLLRLRSVCSSWRKSLSPPPQKPFSFPLKVPPASEMQTHKGNNDYYYALYENIFYRLTPLAYGDRASDPSNGWMFKVSETKPNAFPLLLPLSIEKMDCPTGTIPEHLNLLYYDISEISKSYILKTVNFDGIPIELEGPVQQDDVKKVIALWNYVADSEFAALGLCYDDNLVYWKFGDGNWTQVDTKGHKIHDMILFDGTCYALDSEAVLISLDSKLQMTVVSSSAGYYSTEQYNYLVDCESELYVVSRAYNLGPEFFYSRTDQWETFVDFALMLSKFNKSNSNWDSIRDLGDKVFLLCDEGTVGVSTKGFKGCKGNCIYLADWRFSDYGKTQIEMNHDDAGIYHLENRRAEKMSMDKDSRKLYWPPPSWLMPIASSSEP